MGKNLAFFPFFFKTGGHAGYIYDAQKNKEDLMALGPVGVIISPKDTWMIFSYRAS